MTKDEALKMAIDDLELCNGAQTVEEIIIYTHDAIQACKEALKQPSQGIELEWYNKGWDDAKKDWQGLSDDEITALVRLSEERRFELCDLIEQALKEKNG